MFYSVEIEVPANTAQSAPVITRIPVTHGVVTQVSYRPRPGHSALCHAVVSYHEHQVWPVSREETLHGDTFPIEWGDYLEIFTEPFELLVRSWNEDTTYAHSFDLSFALLPERIVAPVNWSKVFSDILTLLSPRRILGGGG